MDDLWFLFLGYGAIWVILGFYLFTLARRQAHLRREAERIEREFRDTGPGPSESVGSAGSA